ncbi:hypothetical protein ABT001_24465 [Streptomyces sp. NPDC002793]|uniref:hypothetical protein n=1 Tax=Streptomyces sp. NPDC002793 TaxID=3154432 RepID=UPI00332EDA0A
MNQFTAVLAGDFPARRSLLDELFRGHGRTPGDPEAGFEITRFAVVKHLGPLWAAGPVVTRRGAGAAPLPWSRRPSDSSTTGG